jgi:osmotically inducible protein OsmC
MSSLCQQDNSQGRFYYLGLAGVIIKYLRQKITGRVGVGDCQRFDPRRHLAEMHFAAIDTCSSDSARFGREHTYRGEPEMKIKRKGSAAWQGGIKDGKGSISTESGALKAYPYGFASRFEGQRGSNPEELIAAAHASCFTMALSLILGEAKLTAEQMDTSAEVTLEQVEGGYAITSVHLVLKAKVPATDQATFEKLTAKAKAGCPVSKLLKAQITLDATLIG